MAKELKYAIRRKLIDSLLWVPVFSATLSSVGRQDFLTPFLLGLLVATTHFAIQSVTYWLAGAPDFSSVRDLAWAWLISLVSGALASGVFLLQTPDIVSPHILVFLVLSHAQISLAFRFLARALSRRKLWTSSRLRILIYGAGDAGRQTVRMLHSESSQLYRVVAFLDDDEKKRGTVLEGVRVSGGLPSLKKEVLNKNIDRLLVAITAISAERLKEVRRLASDAGVAVSIIPSAADIVWNKWFTSSSVNSLIDPEDLLGRREVRIDREGVKRFLANQRILVTGAGGSIGSEIVRQLNGLGLGPVGILDSSEASLHQLLMSLHGRGLSAGDDVFLADIRDRRALESAFGRFKPTVVFHAAALKHLKFLERFPEEAEKTNVLGTRNVAEVAAQFQVKTLVNISTDKAADPTSVLGRSKKKTEEIVQNVALSHKSRSRQKFMSVRFGNVLGSKGSVLEIFREQLRTDGPLTITDPEVERFFMTIPEAVKLVLQACITGRNGQTLVLDMGEPVKILDVARALMEASGKEVPILYTGLAPGEKLSESLTSSEEYLKATGHPKIMLVEPANSAR